MFHDTQAARNRPVIIFPNKQVRNLLNQCDACSPVVSAQTQNFKKLNPNNDLRLLLADEIIEMPIGRKYVACLTPSNQTFSVLNHKAKNILNTFSKIKSMGHVLQKWKQEEDLPTLLLEFLKAGLIRSKMDSDRQFIESPHKLTAWLHITDKCNLRRSYCYLPHKNRDMSETVGRAAIDAVFRSAIIHNYKKIKLKYAGGEPLLRFDLIRILHRYALKQAEEKQIEIEGAILTNGTLLTKNKIELIQTLNLRVMVSMDGIDPAHDCQRHFTDGTGSFEQTANGVELLLKEDMYPDISVTVTKQNADKLPELTQWLLDHKLPFTFNLYRENEFSKSRSGLKLEAKYIIKGLKSAYKVIESNPPDRCLLACLADQTNLAVPHLRPCSVGHSYLVIDYLGRISKCQMEMNKPVTSIYEYDPLSIIRQDKAVIHNLSVEDKISCRHCKWKYWCAGGCPLANFRATGRYDAKSPNCIIYQALFPEIMRLEALMLVKYHGLKN